MLLEKKIIMPIITAKVPVNMVASVLVYLESGYRSNWNELAVDTYRYGIGTGYLQKGLLLLIELVETSSLG